MINTNEVDTPLTTREVAESEEVMSPSRGIEEVEVSVQEGLPRIKRRRIRKKAILIILVWLAPIFIALIMSKVMMAEQKVEFYNKYVKVFAVKMDNLMKWIDTIVFGSPFFQRSLRSIIAALQSLLI